jgi:hypothetical protein
MGRTCSICAHPQRPAIDRELAAGLQAALERPGADSRG